MMTCAGRGGFTFIEVLIVLVMASVLAAIGLPKFLRAQKNAKHSEVVTTLKSLHANMSMQAYRPTSIHVGHFKPKRGNRHSYHLSGSCSTYEDRSQRHAITNPEDVCIGVDTFGLSAGHYTAEVALLYRTLPPRVLREIGITPPPEAVVPFVMAQEALAFSR